MEAKAKGGARPPVRPDDKRLNASYRGGGHTVDIKPISMVRLSPVAGAQVAELTKFLRIHDGDKTLPCQEVVERAINMLHLEIFRS